ncbi:uncharacterized protein [Battus philenor]|uniref:uncharacterized protein n=1 Tax=Battus philenor TaxID=42288 RepID=UPI0035D073DF
MEDEDEDRCNCWTLLDDIYSFGIRKYRPSPGTLAFEDWRRNPFIWLQYVESNKGLQISDYVLRANDTIYWAIPEVQRYVLGKLHCEEVLFTCQYPNLKMPTPLGNHTWRNHAALKKSPALYLKEFHRCLESMLKKMEAEETQIDRLIVNDQLIKINLLDHYKRKTFFDVLLNIISLQDSLQLVSIENLLCLRLEGVRLIQQLACFCAHSLKYLFLWNFVRSNENPILVNYSYITGSGKYIPRPDTTQCFLRSLGELRNLRVLALEYSQIADGTGAALIFLLPVIKRPHFRLQILCTEQHTPGRADPSLGGGGNGIPDYVWRSVAITCPDLFLAMVFHRMRDYDHVLRFLTASVPLREVHLLQGIRLDGQDFDTDSFVRHVAGHYASILVTLSIQQCRNTTFPLRRTLERLPCLVRFHCVGPVEEKDLREMLLLIAYGVCYNLQEVSMLLEVKHETRDHWNRVVSQLNEEYKEIMKLFDIDFSLKVY